MFPFELELSDFIEHVFVCNDIFGRYTHAALEKISQADQHIGHVS